MAWRGIALELEAARRERGHQAAGKNAGYRRDAEVQRQAGREHGILETIGDRRDEGERGHRDGIEVVGAEMAGDEPACRNEKTYDDSRCDLAGRAAERRVCQGKQDQRKNDGSCSQRTREMFGDTERRQQRWQRIGVDGDLRSLNKRDARRCNQALECHLRGDGKHDHDDEGAEIAAAEQHQRPRTAAVRQHHAVAEQQAAQEQHRHRKGRLQIDGLAEVDHAVARQQLAGGDRNGHRQRIGAHQPAVPLCEPAAHAAHKAEAAEQADGAIDQADGQAREDDEVGGRFHGYGFRTIRSRDEPATAAYASFARSSG